MNSQVDKILMFDDDSELCERLAQNMENQPFEFHYSNDPEKDFILIESLKPRLILLDVGFPYCNGFDILKKIRSFTDTAVIMLTARGDELDRVLGLELGADDYLPKPFYMRELLARIKAVLRRKLQYDNPARNPRIIEYDDLKLNISTRTLYKNDEEIVLTSREFDLIKMLIENANTVISKDDLSRKIFHRQFDSIDRSLDVHLSRLRKKIGLSSKGEDRIRTIRNAGIIFS